jgi:hypothetical protein
MAHDNCGLATRREALCRLGAGFGMTALAGMLQQTLEAHELADPWAARKPHFKARAKHLIFLFLNGGLSQIDSFDRKPLLDKYHGQPLPYDTPPTEFTTGNLMRSPFTWERYGRSGVEISELFPLIGKSIDDFCIIRSMKADIPNHGPSMLLMNTGHNQPGRPSMGSWVAYGLGTENRNLPGFIVLSPGAQEVGGPRLWNSAFLPTVYQGTFISHREVDPKRQIQFLEDPGANPARQRRQMDLLAKLNGMHLERQHEQVPELEATIQSMETAFRMQTEAPEVFDARRESAATLERYGPGDFARGCLLARRLVEKGVRMVQVYYGNNNDWDTHVDILAHRRLAHFSDRPIAALIDDLKERGLFDETVVLIGSEFGRTPVVHIGGAAAVQNGRDHNIHGFTYLLAGGGVKRGYIHGATDDFGFKVTENPVHVHDLHATVLHLLGLDHERLTYRFSGRDFRLTDVHGRVVREIIA